MKLKIGILYYLPVDSLKYSCWNDGFTAAVEILSIEHEIFWFNLDETDDIHLMNACDIIVVKSNWRWIVDRFVQKNKAKFNVPLIILISGSIPVPSRRHASAYVHLLFQTPWYEKFIPTGLSASMAFGINTRIYSPTNDKIKYDNISIGALRHYKRHHFILKQGGRNAVIGDQNAAEAKRIKWVLEMNEIDVFDYQPPEKLNILINKSRIIYIPATLHGGGERALLEGRACNKAVEIEKDNPKLQSLLDIPILDQKFYADGIINAVLKYT